jgi:hypothetical protein
MNYSKFFDKDIFLGTDLDGQDVYLDPKTRAEHMHVMGSTGEGKSKFLEHMIRQDIINGDGLCLIDPHGSLYDNIVKWITLNQYDLSSRKIILLNPSEDEWTFNFNPLRERAGSEMSFVVSRMIEGCAKVWGENNTDKTPLLERCLRALLYALLANKLPLSDSELIIKPKVPEIRPFLTGNIDQDLYHQEWVYFNSLRPKEFEEIFLSTINRLIRFLGSDFIKPIIGQVAHSLDFFKIMEEGAIVLVNLNDKGKYDSGNAKLLGTLMINDMLVCAKARKPDTSRPFYLYVDECTNYLNGDVASILNECRKFGLHLILAHQYLYQLTKAGEDIYHAVMNTAKTKVVFGGLAPDDAEKMAELVFMGELDLSEPIAILNKPTVVGYETIVLKGRSHSSGTSYTENQSQSSGSGSSRSSSQTVSYPENEPLAYNRQVADMEGSSNNSFSSQSYGYSSGEFASDSESESEALKPILEILPTAVYDLEKQRYKVKALLVNLPKQYAIIKLPKQKSQIVKIPTIESYQDNEELQNHIDRFIKTNYETSGFIRARKEVLKEIKERENALYELAKPKPQQDPDNFKTQGRPREEQPEEISDLIKAPGRKRKSTKL